MLVIVVLCLIIASQVVCVDVELGFERKLVVGDLVILMALDVFEGGKIG